MTSEVRDARVSPAARFEFAPHHCFACGSLNTHGLHLDLHLEAGRSWTELSLEPRFQGWEGIAHGGIVATILDEVMAWALVAEDHWGVTARMSVQFRKPVPMTSPIRAEGWITEARRRIVRTAARITDLTTGVELATAEGTYVAADATRRAELQERYGFRFLERATDPATSEGVGTHIDRATPEPVAPR